MHQKGIDLSLQAAELIVANGGSTLLQAVASGNPCIGVPVAKDQAERIRRCVAAGVAGSAPLDGAAIAQAVLSLLDDEARLQALAARTVAVGLTDGVAVAVQALAALLPAAA